MNALKYQWCETNLLSQAVLKQVVFSRSLCKGLDLYPAENEEIYGIILYQKCLSTHISCYITFKKKT